MNEAKHKDAFAEAFEQITVWISGLREYPGFNEWKTASIGATLSSGDPWKRGRQEHPEMFPFPPHITKQHEAITAFFSLHSTWQALADTEFYFRRYPFRDLPVSLDTHLRYTCENYFGRVYEFSERMKKCLNALNEVIPVRFDAGPLIKLFKKEFDQEIKARNLVHHHNRFEEEMIDRIMLEGMLAMGDSDAGRERGWKNEQRYTYRKATKEWADRARKRSARVRDYLNAVAILISQNCTFLTDPITPNLH